jgi:hypothetical protein
MPSKGRGKASLQQKSKPEAAETDIAFTLISGPHIEGLVCKGEGCHFATDHDGMKRLPIGQIDVNLSAKLLVQVSLLARSMVQNEVIRYYFSFEVILIWKFPYVIGSSGTIYSISGD